MNWLKRDDLSTATKGAIAEMATCVDLMQRGYHVFRSQSPACPCDLVAFRPDDSVILRVEVRKGRIHQPSGTVEFGLKLRDSGRFDVMAIVVDGSVGYLPVGIVDPDFPFIPTDNQVARVNSYVLDQPLTRKVAA